MDFYGMKRKRLQSLCKKHGIPANLKNEEMADRLSLIFKGKENPVSCQLGSDSAVAEKDTTFQCVVSGKDKLNVETLDLDSNSGTNNIQMVVASGTGGGNADDCEVKFESSNKMSPGPKGRIDSPLKLDESSKIKWSESERNLPPEGRDDDDIGFFYVEENLQKGVNKKQDDDNQELNPAAPSEDVHVDSELFFGNYLVEGEVEKLCDITDVHIEDTCGTRELIGADTEEQVHTNSPQLESNMNHVNLLHVSPKAESEGRLVEGEVQRLDDNICVHGAVYNDRNNDVSEVASMCLDASIGAKDIGGKTNVTVEHILDVIHSSSFESSDGTPAQFLQTLPLTEVKTSDIDVPKIVVPDTCEAKFVSSQKISNMSPASEKMIDLSPKLVDNSKTPIGDIGHCDVVEEDMQIGVNMEQVDLVQVALEEFGNNLMEGEVNKLDDKIDLPEDVCAFVKQGDNGINSPQGSNIKEVGLLQVEKSNNIMHDGVYNLAKSGSGGVNHALCFFDTSFASKDSTDGNTNVNREHFPVTSSDQLDKILTTHQLSEVISSDLNIHQIVALDTCEEMLKSSPQKTGPEECIGFSSNNLEASVTKKGFGGEAYFVDPSTLGDVVENCHDMKESLQSDNKMEKEKSEEECSFVEGEVVNRLFEYNSDVHDHDHDIGGNQPYDMVSRKRKKCDPNSDDDKEKPADEFVPTMPQPGELLESCNFKLHQVLFASDTASGDEGTYQEEKLESPPKGTPTASSERSISFSPKLLIESSMMHKELESEMNLPMKPERNLVGTCDMKENVRVLDKKEQVGNIISSSKIKFPNKRQPLQDLQQN